MIPSVETAIWEAQKRYLETYPGLPDVVLYPDSLQGAPDVVHIEVTQILTDPVKQFVASGAPSLRRGTLQILFKDPIARPLNYSASLERAGQLAAHFTDGTCMRFAGVRLSVVGAPFVGDGYRDEAWWVTPVRVRWETSA